jgi:hypothetical protein
MNKTIDYIKGKVIPFIFRNWKYWLPMILITVLIMLLPDKRNAEEILKLLGVMCLFILANTYLGVALAEKEETFDEYEFYKGAKMNLAFGIGFMFLSLAGAWYPVIDLTIYNFPFSEYIGGVVNVQDTIKFIIGLYITWNFADIILKVWNGKVWTALRKFVTKNEVKIIEVPVDRDTNNPDNEFGGIG